MSIFQLSGMESIDLYVDTKRCDKSSTSDANKVDPILEYLRRSASQEDSEKPIDVVDLTDDDGDDGEDEVEDSPNRGSIILPFGIKRSNEEIWDRIPSVIDLDQPLTNTSAILNHCLRMARAQVQVQTQAQEELDDLSTMETFADEEIFLGQPPLKKRRFWPVPAQEATEYMFEGQATGSCLCHKEFQDCLEHSVDKLRQENAELRRNLGITAQEALVSMAAEQANNGARYTDEDFLGDPCADDGPRWEADQETLSFLAKYLG